MVDVEREGPVAGIFLNRPEKANALSGGPGRASDTLQQLAPDPSLRAVVLAGRGSAFCGGADVAELTALTEETAGAFVMRIHDVCTAIRALPVPVVARLHGADRRAAGAGMGSH